MTQIDTQCEHARQQRQLSIDRDGRRGRVVDRCESCRATLAWTNYARHPLTHHLEPVTADYADCADSTNQLASTALLTFAF